MTEIESHFIVEDTEKLMRALKSTVFQVIPIFIIFS